VTESAQAYALADKYPVTEGHTLVLPKRHVNNYFDLSEREQTACWIMVNRVQSLLQDKHDPDGFNVGINVGTKAGQTVPHAHVHVIPRYEGDVDDPTGGVRNVIPEKGNYLSRATEDS
jgi:diadenosine tetraphosphate (Ap4A) HIT family hydrolase